MRVETIPMKTILSVLLLFFPVTADARLASKKAISRKLQESTLCCSWDMKNCGSSAWCNGAQDRCENNCGGTWVDTSLTETCVAKWQSCLDYDEDPCCPGTVCTVANQYWSSCQDGTKAPVSDPTPSPQTASPVTPATESPITPVPVTDAPITPAPITQAPVTSAPVPAPVVTTAPVTAAPVTKAPVTAAPVTKAPVTAAPVTKTPTVPIPGGPYITAENSSERVIIPDPPAPEFPAKTGCPHLESGLLDWHNTATWGGSLPSGGDVVLPNNARVVITQPILEKLGVVTVPTNSELIFGENVAGITLDLDGMDVEGKLTAGAESCRLDTPVTITLYGERPNDAVTNVREETYKGISVTGEISFHGKRYYRTWTRLAKTVQIGDDIVLLQHEVNWEPGQEIVLVTTAMKDSIEWHENEVAVIAEVVNSPVSGVGAAVYLTEPVKHRHLALSNYQGEVGLLTRTIKVQGAEDSEPVDNDPLTCTGIYRFGDNSVPCSDKELTGFGGHIIVHNGGKGYVEGVELYRMGQTNVLGRYPMHFHLLTDSPDCYFRDSSVHRSFYRCVSIHGTNYLKVNENVAYDVRGYCYYLEDGVEENNDITFNLAAFIHMIGDGDPPTGSGQQTPVYSQSDTLTLPADVTAAGFYVTNVHNNIIGNAASGGWAGFAFPVLPEPLGPHNGLNYRPSGVLELTIDGNTAHSTGWWWGHAGAFYWGGALYYENNILKYNPGRAFGFDRLVCSVDKCTTGNQNCFAGCPEHQAAWIEITNSKAFLTAGVGLNSWNGRMEVHGFEAHDTALSVEALVDGFYLDNLLAVCRTGETLGLPSAARANRIKGNGFFWYDTNQEHIITNSLFRNCGYRSDELDQYDTSPTRGCDSDAEFGCTSLSTVFGFLTHSDQFNPEIMQGTRAITFENCGRRFYLHDYRASYSDVESTTSGRLQNWFDADGSVTQLNVPSLIGSGLEDAGDWWNLDDNVVYDPQGPLYFIKQTDGPERGLGHVRMRFDYAQHNNVGGSVCGNGSNSPCVALGYMRHVGKMFAGDQGLPVTAAGDVAGPVGGYGWYFELLEGAPAEIKFDLIEVKPDTPLIFSVAYPLGTTFTITAYAAWCNNDQYYSCQEVFNEVDSVDLVRTSLGNVYHFDDTTGLLTFRIIQTPQAFIGNPEYFLPTYSDIGKWDNGYALNRFERGGVLLPKMSYGPYLHVVADCPTLGSNSAYCSGTRQDMSNYDVCPDGYEQVSYDKCCEVGGSACVYADGSAS